MRDSIKYTTVGVVSLLIGAGIWSWKLDGGDPRYPIPALLFTGVGVIAVCLAIVEAFVTSEDRQKDMP